MRIIEDAIILAGGKGTRMLPASLYSAKETLPLIDTPLINHLIWEACESGVKRIHLVHSPDKKTQFEKIWNRKEIFDSNHNNIEFNKKILNILPNNVELKLYEQKEPGGIGDALSCVIDYISGAFLLILGDNILINNHLSPRNFGLGNGSKASKELVEYYIENGGACAGLRFVNDDELHNFGVVGLEGDLINEIIEKPKSVNSPSNHVLCGRYIFLENTKDLLNTYPKDKFGELQSIAILNHYIDNSDLFGIKLDEYDLYDSGNPLSWLKSQIDHALKRDDLKNEIKEWILKIINN